MLIRARQERARYRVSKSQNKPLMFLKFGSGEAGWFVSLG